MGRYMVSARGYWGLPEFDTNAYSTDLAIEAMERACVGCLVRDFLILEPGIGLAALWAGRALGPLIIRGRTRDWLASRAIQENLKASFPGIRYAAENSAESTEYAIPPHDLSDALLVFPDMVPESEGVQPIWQLVLDRAKRGASVVIVAASGVTSRFDRIKPKGLVRMGEKRKKGLCALMLRRE